LARSHRIPYETFQQAGWRRVLQFVASEIAHAADDARWHDARSDDVGNGIGWILILVFLVLGIASFIKYLFFNRKP
jgi:hypothetical protein